MTKRVAREPEGLPRVDEDPRLEIRLRALHDLALAETAAVTFVRSTQAAQAIAFFDALEERAWRDGFVTARVAVFEQRAFDSFDGLVRAVGRSLSRGTDERGVVGLLDAYAVRHGDAVLTQFDRGAVRAHAAGDLHALARSYLESRVSRGAAFSRLDAWLAGTDLARADPAPVTLAPLTPRTSRRALADITRLVRVLGHAGTLIVFEGVDVLVRLPAARREAAYTVLRELIDNADSGRGLVATQILAVGGPKLFEGKRSLTSLTALASRVMLSDPAPPTDPAPPFRPWIDLDQPPAPCVLLPRPSRPPKAPELRALIRASQGLPAVDPVVSMSVGHEQIDASIDQLFEHSAMEGSVFALLSGAYGSGKTHLLLHLMARALDDGRPVFRLSIEQLDADLGNPQRHLRRLLDDAILPLRHRPSVIDRLQAWTRSRGSLRRLLTALDALAREGGEVSAVARRAHRLGSAEQGGGLALEAYLSGSGLTERSAAASYRADAYARILLWLALLERLEDSSGPVVIIDEAENLYRGGTTRAERRTALRSLAFYCGGALPRACVVLAITPDALARLREDAPALLDDLAGQKTLLPVEDVAMFRQRLRRARAMTVPPLSPDFLSVLAYRLRAMHEQVRGPVVDPQWATFVDELARSGRGTREAVRCIADRLEVRALVGADAGVTPPG